MLKRFIAYYKPHYKLLTMDMIAALFISAIGMVYPMLTRTMINTLIPEKQISMIVLFGISLLALYALRMGLRYFVQYYGHVIGVRMQAKMRSDLFAKLEQLPYTFYDNHETGKIMSRMTNDLMDVSELAHHGPENLFISGVMIIGSFIYLCTIDVILTLIVFACVPILVAVSFCMRKRMTAAFMESRKSIAVINASLESSISGIRVTKAYTNAEREKEKFETSNTRYVEARKKSYSAMGAFFSSTSFITDVFNVIVLIAGGLFMYHERIDFADYTAFVLSINLFINPVMTVVNFMEQYQNGVTGFTRFLEIMDEKPEPESPNARSMGRVKGDIEFRNVEFSYGAAQGFSEKGTERGAGLLADASAEAAPKEVLHNISLRVRVGEKLALVGPSGGGKTTICHLIPSFYRPTKGVIAIDGVDISEYTLESLRRNIGIVQQDVFLFGGTIRENILYGRLDATDEEVIEAAKRANIHDYVITLQEGYDSQIGERGVRLSGGQKQRLSIARVFLKNPAILILDEATSALDNTTEILIQQALDELCKGRTTIVVAHRLSTIKNADEIAVVSDGQITERGTHDQLMENDGMYKKLYSLQFRPDAAADFLKMA